MNKRSIHDNFVLGYSVDCEAKTLHIRTEYREKSPFEKTDIIFKDLKGYLIKYSIGGILTDIIETDIETIIDQYPNAFARGEKYGWPWTGNTGRISVTEFVQNAQAKVFELCSAVGFDGFVIADSMQIQAAP